MESKENFYETLGISEKATDDEIKKSYRKLSLQYHPDRNNNDPKFVEKFQKISEAYETLSDKQKRQEYDMTRNNPFLNAFGSNSFHNTNLNSDDIFQAFFGGLGGGGMGEGFGMPPFMGGFGPGVKIQAFHNGVPVNIGMNGNHFMENMKKPTPIIKNIIIQMSQVLSGANLPVDIERWIVENGNKVFEKETLYVPIPQGIDDNEIILLREKGNMMNEHLKGDVKIFVKIENKTEFERRGLDLHYSKKISLKDALCGFTFDILYLNGKTYTLNNHSGNIIQPNYTKVIPNMGITREGHSGNLIITFQVDFPDRLDAEKIQKLKEIL
jgi:DnaJ-class molecular chaperone